MTIENAIAYAQNKGFTIARKFKKSGRGINPRFFVKNPQGQPISANPNGLTAPSLIVLVESGYIDAAYPINSLCGACLRYHAMIVHSEPCPKS